jgi:hypothetical protein
MTILQNAVDSIAIGLEDFKSDDSRRLLSSTRNIFAGILLLFKHHLQQLSTPNSDEALIKAKVIPKLDESNTLSWVGKGPKTVDLQNIKERFMSLNISVDWNKVDEINKYRNNIEHYYENREEEVVKQLISNSFIVIHEFIKNVLKSDPKETLGDYSWNILVDIDEIHKKEKEECFNELKKLTYYHDIILDILKKYNCSNCGSGLIKPIDSLGHAEYTSFECRSCKKIADYETIVCEATQEYYSYHNYSYYKGEEYDLAVINCSSCGRTDSYLYTEQICVACGESIDHECAGCHCPIPSNEIGYSEFCSNCQYRYENIMRE